MHPQEVKLSIDSNIRISLNLPCAPLVDHFVMISIIILAGLSMIHPATVGC